LSPASPSKYNDVVSKKTISRSVNKSRRRANSCS
jgi:hypothetical protein